MKSILSRLRAFIFKVYLFISFKKIKFHSNLLKGKSVKVFIGNRTTIMKYGFITLMDFCKFSIGKNVCICQGSEIILTKGSTLKVLDNTYIGSNINLRCSGNIQIGSNVRIAQNVSIIDSNYDISNGFIGDLIPNDIIIEDNVWIGAGAIILPGVVIGNSSIIGAGSVVTKSVNKSSLWFGNPARFIKDL